MQPAGVMNGVTQTGSQAGRHDLAAVVVLLIASAVALWTWRDYGVTWDETYHLEYGRHIYAFFASGFEDRTALNYRLDYLYGGGFDLSGALFCRLVAPVLDRFEAIHLFGTLVGIAGLWGTWRLSRVLGGPRAGLLGALFITATAVYWGHMAANPKDLPFAVGYVWALALLLETIRSFPRVAPARAVGLAVVMGLAMSVRIAGLLLPCYLAGAILVWLVHRAWQLRAAEALYREGRRLALTGLLVSAGAWLVMVLWWPWALFDPIGRPLAALRRMSQFMGLNRDMPFAGKLVSTYDVDWRYMPHYFGLKLPEFIVLASVPAVLLIAIRLWGNRREPELLQRNLVFGTLLVALLFPWLYSVARSSIVYDGLRHFLFEVPVVVATVAYFVDSLLSAALARFGRRAGVAAAGLIALACIDQYATMVRLHPYEYVYFNRFIGGLAGAIDRYDTDYYAASYGEAGELLAAHLWRTEPERFLDSLYLVGSCVGDDIALRRLPPNFRARKRKADFWLGYRRDGCHLRHPEAPIVVEVEREGGVLLIGRDLRQGGGR